MLRWPPQLGDDLHGAGRREPFGHAVQVGAGCGVAEFGFRQVGDGFALGQHEVDFMPFLPRRP